MKKIIVLLIILVSISQFSFAKKDVNAWKNEKNMDEQFSVFKQNLNFWNSSYFLSETQFNEFYRAITDTILVMKKEVANVHMQRETMQKDMDANNKLTQETQFKLDESIKHQDSIEVFGMHINKNVYSVSMYIFILAVLVIAGIAFLLFIRSNKTTKHTKKEYKELKEEFEIHKKNSLDRYTKINTELHKTRMELNRK
jgi:hypothetical protein